MPLRRPIAAKVGQFTHWPLILIDLHTRECVVVEWSDWASPILAEPPRPAAQGGIVTLPSAPGSGIAWDEAAHALCNLRQGPDQRTTCLHDPRQRVLPVAGHHEPHCPLTNDGASSLRARGRARHALAPAITAATDP